jgi:leucyl-tRNA synthetase
VPGWSPYLGEEFSPELGHRESIHLEAWPKFDPELTRDETVTVVVQVNGRVRDRLQVPADNSEDANVALALSREPVLGRV